MIREQESNPPMSPSEYSEAMEGIRKEEVKIQRLRDYMM